MIDPAVTKWQVGNYTCEVQKRNGHSRKSERWLWRVVWPTRTWAGEDMPRVLSFGYSPDAEDAKRAAQEEAKALAT
jgi:hypothetical protein